MSIFFYLPLILMKMGYRTSKKRVKPHIPFLASDSTEELGFVTSDGVDIHMVARGDRKGQVVLFLHGFPECWYSWNKQIEFFARNGYRAVAMSLRGYAESGKPQGKANYKTDKLVNDVKELIEYLGVSQVYLVSHDWGGAIAWIFAAKYPEMVKRLVVINAPYHKLFFKLQMEHLGQFLSSWYIYFFQWPYLPEMMMRFSDYAFLDACFDPIVVKGKLTKEEIHLFKYYAEKPGALTCMVNYYRNIGSSDTKKEMKLLSNITVPTLVIWGEKDEALVVENLKGLGDHVDDLHVTRLPGVSHWVQQEDPDTVNREIYSFIIIHNISM